MNEITDNPIAPDNTINVISLEWTIFYEQLLIMKLYRVLLRLLSNFRLYSDQSFFEKNLKQFTIE